MGDKNLGAPFNKRTGQNLNAMLQEQLRTKPLLWDNIINGCHFFHPPCKSLAYMHCSVILIALVGPSSVCQISEQELWNVT